MFTKEEFAKALKESPLSLMSGDYYDRECNSGCALTVMYFHLHPHLNHFAFIEEDLVNTVRHYWEDKIGVDEVEWFMNGFDGCLSSTKSPYYLLGKELRMTYL